MHTCLCLSQHLLTVAMGLVELPPPVILGVSWILGNFQSTYFQIWFLHHFLLSFWSWYTNFRCFTMMHMFLILFLNNFHCFYLSVPVWILSTVLSFTSWILCSDGSNMLSNTTFEFLILVFVISNHRLQESSLMKFSIFSSIFKVCS